MHINLKYFSTLLNPSLDPTVHRHRFYAFGFLVKCVTVNKLLLPNNCFVVPRQNDKLSRPQT